MELQVEVTGDLDSDADDVGQRRPTSQVDPGTFDMRGTPHMALLRKSSLGPGNKDICGKESRALPNGGTVDVEMFFHRDNARSHCKRRSPCAETPSVPVTQPLKPLAICQCCEINKMARGGRNGCQLLPMGCHCSPIDRLSVSATPHFVSPPSEIIRHNATEGGLLDGTCRSN